MVRKFIVPYITVRRIPDQLFRYFSYPAIADSVFSSFLANSFTYVCHCLMTPPRSVDIR